MNRIALTLLAVSLVDNPSLAANPRGPEPSRSSVDRERELSKPSDDQPEDQTPGEGAPGDAASLSSRLNDPSWRPDPSPTRLIVGPTARSLKQGEVYVDLNGLVGGPFLQVGITDRISIGAGTPVLIPGIRPGEAFVLTPKLQLFKGTGTTAAVGVIYGKAGNHSGIAYGVVTHGTGDASVTVGLAVPPMGSEKSSHAPVVMLGGEKRVTRTIKLISENFVATPARVVGAGVRFIGRRGTFDLGFAVPIGSDGVLPMFRLARTF